MHEGRGGVLRCKHALRSIQWPTCKTNISNLLYRMFKHLNYSEIEYRTKNIHWHPFSIECFHCSMGHYYYHSGATTHLKLISRKIHSFITYNSLQYQYNLLTWFRLVFSRYKAVLCLWFTGRYWNTSNVGYPADRLLSGGIIGGDDRPDYNNLAIINTENFLLI